MWRGYLWRNRGVWHDRVRDVRGPEEHSLAWERACLLRMQRGDRAAFAELYRAFAPKLYREILMPKLGHAQAAEDALAETFASLLANLSQLEVRDQSLMHWLACVARNKAIDAHRKASRTRRTLAGFEGLLGVSQEHAEARSPLEDEQLRDQAARDVAGVLERINPRYRKALELRFWQERGRDECAVLLELNVGTFDVLLLRALRAFRREWDAAQEASRERP